MRPRRLACALRAMKPTESMLQGVDLGEWDGLGMSCRGQAARVECSGGGVSLKSGSYAERQPGSGDLR